jgi:hypothetical protein
MLNARPINIIDGSESPAVVTLEVRSHGQVDSTETTLDVVTASPSVDFTLDPLTSEGCGDAVYHLEATFAEANPLDSPLEIWVDWNFTFAEFGLPPSELADAEPLVGFTPAGFNLLGFPQYTIEADHPYVGFSGSTAVAVWVLAPGADFETQSEVGFDFDFFTIASGGGTPPEVSVDPLAAISEGSGVTIFAHVNEHMAGDYDWQISSDVSGGFVEFVPDSTDGETATFILDWEDLAALGIDDSRETDYIITVDALPCECSCDPVPDEVGLTVNNAAPTATLNGQTPGLRRQLYTVQPHDASSVDESSLTVQVDWGDGTPLTPVSLQHSYASAGPYTITITVTDKDGGTSTSTHPITIQESVSDPNGNLLTLNASGNLSIIAIDSDNSISLSSGSLIVNIDGHIVEFDPVPTKVTINAGNGNDVITVGPGVTSTVVINGGAGADIIMGGDGNDVIVGGSGRDILIGGAGADGISGNFEDDILVGGTIQFGAADPVASLTAIRNEWTSSASLLQRIANIEGWGGDPTSFNLNNQTVHDDNAKDTLAGDQGLDWFFANLWLDNGDDANKKDKIVDMNLFELLFANDLDL